MAAVFRALRVSELVRSIACRPCTCELACSSSYGTPHTYVGDGYRGVETFARHRHRKQAQKTEESIDLDDQPEILSDTVDDSFYDQAQIRDPVDLDYKSPTERVWPASRRQQKFAGRVRDALQTVMMFTDSNAFKDLTGRYGFTVVEVRMSPDNSTAYILWDAFPECPEGAERELKQRTSRLRRSLAQALKSRHVPRLEFRRDAPSSEELAVEQVLQRLQAES